MMLTEPFCGDRQTDVHVHTCSTYLSHILDELIEILENLSCIHVLEVTTKCHHYVVSLKALSL